MVQEEAPLLVNRPVYPDHYLMRLKSPAVAQRSKPGQFVHLRCGGGDFPLLRRPFSLLNVDLRRGTIDLIYKVVGLGTRTLARIREGSTLNLLGPLGSSFTVPAGTKRACLVGGGVGIPPMVFLAKSLLKQGIPAEPFLGARTRGWVICLSDFRAMGLCPWVATDDGTLGEQGSVVDLLKGNLQSLNGSRKGTTLYVCGPTPMMRSAADLGRRMDLKTQVSLEERMGCGMGVCMGCVVEVTTEPPDSHKRFQRVCTEGPVFPAEEVAWR
ncbi:MAG: dihydroorotate dehydrogenase electron transfer subunit [Candidatus Omnitrophica bacterium]|nr:dihydroorotate dehydrogenase electron transfer subunit [Candidatus Omnitrophota bacterium]